MPTVSKSGIKFDFDAANSWVKHDLIDREWPAVDFIIDRTHDWIWLEVRSRSNLKGIKRELSELRDKFLGTTAFLAHSGTFQSKPLNYVAIIDSTKMDETMKATFSNSLNNQIRTSYPWVHTIETIVMDVNDWNALYPEYPARVE